VAAWAKIKGEQAPSKHAETNAMANTTHGSGTRLASLHSKGSPTAEPCMRQATKGRPPAKVAMEDLKALFDRPQPEAAKALKISLTTLKQVCRRHGLHRWPYRRVCKPTRARNVVAQPVVVPALTPDLAQTAGPLRGSACMDTVMRTESPGTSSRLRKPHANRQTQFFERPRTGPDYWTGIPGSDSRISWCNTAIGMPAHPPASYGAWHGLHGRDASTDEEDEWCSMISKQIVSDVILSTGSTVSSVSTWQHQAQHPAPMVLHSSHLVGGPEFPHYLVDHHHTGKIRND